MRLVSNGAMAAIVSGGLDIRLSGPAVLAGHKKNGAPEGAPLFDQTLSEEGNQNL